MTRRAQASTAPAAPLPLGDLSKPDRPFSEVRGKLLGLGVILGLFAALWLVYRHAFPTTFYLDTILHLVSKTNLHLTSVTWEGLDNASRLDFGGNVYRPLSMVSLALTHAFFGLDPRAYRIGNLAIHCGASLSLLFLFLSVARVRRVRQHHPELARRAFPVGLVAVALWALHPVQTNVVTYIIQRMAGLSGLFAFLGAGAYLRARTAPGGWSWAWGTLFLAGLAGALGSKETALVLIPLLASAEILLLGEPSRRRTLAVLAILGLVGLAGVGALAAWRGKPLWDFAGALSATRDFSPGERLLTQARIQANYLFLLLVPDSRLLVLDAQIPVSRSLLDPPETLGAVLAILGALGLAIASARRRPLLAFGILWFFLAQLVESTILPLELYFEHRLYVPSAFLFLGLGWVLWRLVERGGRVRVAGLALVALVLGVEGWSTYERNALWASPVTFHLDNVAKAPDKARTHQNLGYVLRRSGFYQEAREEFLAALRLGGEKPENYLNLAAIAFEQRDYAEARRLLREGIGEAGDRAWKWHVDWANLELEDGNYAEALAHLDKALAANPRDSWALYLYGEALRRTGSPERAEAAYRMSVRFDPAYGAPWHGLGILALESGRPAEAVDHLERAIRYDPEDPAYRQDLERARRLLRGGD